MTILENTLEEAAGIKEKKIRKIRITHGGCPSFRATKKILEMLKVYKI